MLKKIVRSVTLHFLPDHCSIRYPWFYYGEKYSPIWKCHIFSHRTYLRQNRDLSKRSIIMRIIWILGGLLWPINCLIRIFCALYFLGPYYKKEKKISYHNQFFMLIYNAFRYNIPPKNFYKYELFCKKKSLVSKPWDYIHDYEIAVIHRTVYFKNEKKALSIGNKVSFVKKCFLNNIRCASTILSCNSGKFEWYIDPMEIRKVDLVVKTANDCSGEGIHFWFYMNDTCKWKMLGSVSDGYWNEESVALLNEEELKKYIIERSFKKEILVQERISNHRDISRIFAKGLSTIRLVTTWCKDNKIDIIGGCMRMPSGKSLIDNICAGGLAANVDIIEETLGPAIYHEIQKGVFKNHPDTNQEIEKFHIPFLTDAKELVCKAHYYFGDYPSIGWDIVITDDGPALLEGNTMWGGQLLQETPGGTGLGKTSFVQLMEAHLDIVG